MGRLFIVFGTLSLGLATPVLASPVTDTDRQSLEQLAAANDVAWGARDVATMSNQYTGDGSVRVSPNAPVIAGRGAVTKFFGEAFARRQGVHRHITALDHIELIAPDTALVDGGVRVERQEPDGRWMLVRTFRNISVAVREKGAWKLRSVRAIPQN